MKVNRKSLKRLPILLGMLLLNSMLIGLLVLPGAPLVQAGPSARKTRVPTQTSTPISTATQMPAPFFTPTAGPTTTVNGSWKIVSSPNVGTGTYGNRLNAVTAVSANDVWAVGFSPHPSGTPLYIRQTLIEHWDGRNWSVVPSPNPAGDTDVELNGVDAISSSDVWAVGHSGDPSTIPQTLTVHWNGNSWSIVPSPSPGTYNGNVLNAVSGVSANDIWAVGWYQSGATGQEGGALTMHWDGTAWTVVPNPSRWQLYGVTAISSNDVWAVGEQSILHWNGMNWSAVSFPPPPGDSYQVFKGISAVSANDIWAVGYSQWSYFYGYRYAPLTYHWDGTRWSWVPNAGGTDEFMFAVTAIAANDVWAVGDNGQTQHWNGADWSRVAAPYPGLGGRLNGIAAASASDVWAVGTYSDSNQWLTWIDRYTIP
ncbi:MAG TPA: hypothetical protein VFR47_30500 [Anaerolineales bacterium]|nr:hypothetical protein [Anaerolineales bacterium]